VTFFGVFLTPVFYTVIRRFTGYRSAAVDRLVRSIPTSGTGEQRPAVGSALR
jgi:hypothetical protein